MIETDNRKLCESCFCESETETCSNCGFSAAEYSADPLVLPIGTRLKNKIVIGRVMGKGGFGVTYLGYDLRMEKTIAVKEYYPNGIAYRVPGGTEISVNDPKSEETFEKGAEKFFAEAEMVSQFNGNPNIVSVYDYFRTNNTVYLVMEFIEGITLKNYIKKHGRLSDGQALFVTDKIAAALSITHSAGVLHRDISPDNIMICRDGKVKLIDFGAARQILEESSSNLTVVMKHGYTPIEQYTKKGRQGAWTDIYSLGASVYYALTETVIDDPYSRMDNDSELAENIHGINGDLWNILKKCTMISSSDRYGSAIDLRKALKSVSAPMKAEPIVLADDDLKGEEEAPEAEEATKMAGKDFHATAVSPAENEDIIEIFESESESVAPEDHDPYGPYDHKAKASESSAGSAEKKEKGKQKSKKTPMIAAAAAVIIIGAIGIFAVTGDRGNNAVTADNTKAADISEENDVPTAQNTTTAATTKAAATTAAAEAVELVEVNAVSGDLTVTDFFSKKTPAVTLTSGGSYTFKFHNKSNGTNTWDNFVMAVTGEIGDAYKGPDQEVLVVRSDADGWGGGYSDFVSPDQAGNALVFDTNIDRSEWQTGARAGCDVEITISRAGDTLIYDAKIGEYYVKLTATSGKTLPKNTYVFFTGENCVLSGITITNMYVPLNDAYPGDWLYGKNIAKDDFRHFKDRVKITLDIELVHEDEWAALYIVDDRRNLLDIQAYNIGRDTAERYIFYKGQTEFAFVVTGEVLENINNILMNGENVWVKGATMEEYDPRDDEVSADAKIIKLANECTGWSDGTPPIPKKELESFNGDVRVTLEIEPGEFEPDDDGAYRVHILPCGSESNEDGQVNINADYITPCEYGEGNLYALYDRAVPNKFTFTITADEISRLTDYGLFFFGTNCIIRSAALEKA